MTNEEQFIIIIYGLYFIRCIKIIDKDNILLIYNYKRITVKFPIKYFQIESQSFVYLDLFKFYMPTYKIDNKAQGHKNKILIKKIKIYSMKLCKILPNIIIIWVVVLVLLPLSLYFMYETFLIFSLIILYISILMLSIILWKNKEEYQITKKQYFSLLLDYFLCPPFAANTIRDLSLNYYKIDK